MKSYKQRTLDAQADLIRRYEKNDPPDWCPFCEIYQYTNADYLCVGCFMQEKNTADVNGCVRFRSFVQSNSMTYETKEKRKARAAFHRKVRKKLLKRPAKYFTPKGWKYLDIPREW